MARREKVSAHLVHERSAALLQPFGRNQARLHGGLCWANEKTKMSRLSRLFEKFRPAAASHDQPGAERSEIRWMIMGLGNPGEQYRRSRHNLGFMTLRRLAARYNCELSRRKFNGSFNQ